ncbi:hypothetical protein ACFPM7_25545 [Actinokineospora guangxiensis]|uniref:LPXTG cell wall anchor domain-containing protein n=1 Tax=Actinokineospora guangxiensis TaxID=1490288 RepID=A0ABW0EWE1_9PSEU
MSRLLTGMLVAVAVLGAVALGPVATEAVAQTTAPSGPTLNPPTEQDSADSKQKVVIAVVAIALLGIVVYGNRVRHKKAKK